MNSLTTQLTNRQFNLFQLSYTTVNIISTNESSVDCQQTVFCFPEGKSAGKVATATSQYCISLAKTTHPSFLLAKTCHVSLCRSSDSVETSFSLGTYSVINSWPGQSNVNGVRGRVMVWSKIVLSLRVVLHNKVHDGTSLQRTERQKD